MKRRPVPEPIADRGADQDQRRDSRLGQLNVVLHWATLSSSAECSRTRKAVIISGGKRNIARTRSHHCASGPTSIVPVTSVHTQFRKTVTAIFHLPASAKFTGAAYNSLFRACAWVECA